MSFSFYESTMTSTPSGSKEKQKTPEGLGIPTDWRICAVDQPTEESLAVKASTGLDSMTCTKR